uniref:Uncharacterized protein n=1 Tax=viral metagenome TaxID=1070528 RepID=A0A6M3XMF8_9ZZZZ
MKDIFMVSLDKNGGQDNWRGVKEKNETTIEQAAIRGFCKNCQQKCDVMCGFYLFKKEPSRLVNWALPINGNAGEWMYSVDWTRLCKRFSGLCVGGVAKLALPLFYYVYPAPEVFYNLSDYLYIAERDGHEIVHNDHSFYERARLLTKIDAWNPEVYAEYLFECTGSPSGSLLADRRRAGEAARAEIQRINNDPEDHFHSSTHEYSRAWRATEERQRKKLDNFLPDSVIKTAYEQAMVRLCWDNKRAHGSDSSGY